MSDSQGWQVITVTVTSGENLSVSYACAVCQEIQARRIRFQDPKFSPWELLQENQVILISVMLCCTLPLLRAWSGAFSIFERSVLRWV